MALFEHAGVKGSGVTLSVLFTPFHTSGHISFVLDGGDDTPDALFCGARRRRRYARLSIPRAAESALKIRSDIAHLAGDTLFVGGCGRFFEGSAADAYNTMRHVCFTMNQLASMPVALTGMI